MKLFRKLARCFYRSPVDEALDRLADMQRQLSLIRQNQESIMASLDEVLAAVSSNSDRLDSLIVFVDGLEQQLADALANANLSPENQAKVDAIFTKVRDNAAKIDTALNEGTPPPA